MKCGGGGAPGNSAPVRFSEDKTNLHLYIDQYIGKIFIKIIYRKVNMKLENIKALYKRCVSGFTLAEVLITLGIIGIVCAMTLPNLIGKYQKNQTLTLLKKTYTELNQAASLSVAQNGEREYWNYEGYTTDKKAFWKDYIIKYLKTMEVRDVRNVDKQLDPALEYIPGVGSGEGVLKVVLSSGVNLYFWGKSAVMIDLNGRTKPNLPGRDIFIYTLVEPSSASFVKAENFVPSGWDIWRNPVLGSDWHRNVYVNGYASYADHGCKYRSKKDMTSIQNNWFCAALILIDNWDMKDDYPW